MKSENNLFSIKSKELSEQLSNLSAKLRKVSDIAFDLQLSLIDVEHPLSERHRELIIERVEQQIETLKTALKSLQETISSFKTKNFCAA
jgi:hypothetical protein